MILTLENIATHSDYRALHGINVSLRYNNEPRGFHATRWAMVPNIAISHMHQWGLDDFWDRRPASPRKLKLDPNALGDVMVSQDPTELVSNSSDTRQPLRIVQYQESPLVYASSESSLDWLMRTQGTNPGGHARSLFRICLRNRVEISVEFEMLLPTSKQDPRSKRQRDAKGDDRHLHMFGEQPKLSEVPTIPSLY